MLEGGYYDAKKTVQNFSLIKDQTTLCYSWSLKGSH